MTALNKRAQLRKELSNQAIGSNHHLRQLALSLLDELDSAEKRMAEQHGIILSARNFISEYAVNGDVGAAEFVKILDRAAGIGVKGELQGGKCE